MAHVRQINTEPWHALRFHRSLEWLTGLVVKESTRILDVGGASACSAALRLEGFDVRQTSGDLRNRWNLEDNQFDLVICMEVIEHVRDRESDPDVATFSGSGIRHLFAESRRVLRAGGFMFLTTPNVCGFRNLFNLFHERHPFFYSPHHRELTDQEVVAYASESGFQISNRAQLTVWDHHHVPKKEIQRLKHFCRRMGVNPDRGDDLFYLFEAI